MPTLATYTMCVWGKRPTFGFSGTDNVQGEMSWGNMSGGICPGECHTLVPITSHGYY